MLSQMLNINVNGTLSCMATANAQGINITECDMDGDLDMSGNNLQSLPFSLHEVTGDFKIDNNKISQLTGAPNWVGGSFYCRSNTLESLVGCPKVVGANFCCDGNLLTSLAGLPDKIPGILSCANNRIASLSDIRVEVFDTFDLSSNPLKNLRGIDKSLAACGRLVLNGCSIEEGGVSLINVPNLRAIVAFDAGVFERAAEIINKYLELRESTTSQAALMLKCKAELEREGLARFGLI